MEKLKLHSKNITADNIDKIAALFPNCITETEAENGELKKAIDFDLLKQELSTTIVEGQKERYQLNWPGKRKALLNANAPIAKTLRPCREESVDFDSTENLFIEGDNLDALKLLQETYLGKVKMIYIDPPYNTGKDFVYKDNFAQSTDEYLLESEQKDEEGNRLVANTDSNGRFHSDWLSMMYSRLKLARNLLKDDGVIFISIDDNEQANLKRICDEIFGEKSLVGMFPWRSRTAKADVPFGVSNDVEWVLAYAKPNFIAGREGARKYYKSNDLEDRWRLSDLTTNKSKEERPNSFFQMVNPKNGESYASSPIRTWAVTMDTFDDYYKREKIVFPSDYEFLNIKKPAYRVFESEDKQKAIAKYGTDEVRMSISTYLPDKDVGRTEHGSKEIRELFGSQVFQYPKPTSLISFFIKNISDENAIILDFFSGSSTTADAIMQLNAQDKGNRKYIMVQLPEKLDGVRKEQKAAAEFCEENKLPLFITEVAKERIRRSGIKIKKDNAGKEGIDKLDTGFRVLKIDSSNMQDVYYKPDAITQSTLFDTQDNIKTDRTEEDLLFQVLLDWGVDLSLKIVREEIEGENVYFVDDNALAACFSADGKITNELCKNIAGRKPLRAVFRDSGFANDDVKTNVAQIFKQLSPNTDSKIL